MPTKDNVTVDYSELFESLLEDVSEQNCSDDTIVLVVRTPDVVLTNWLHPIIDYYLPREVQYLSASEDEFRKTGLITDEEWAMFLESRRDDVRQFNDDLDHCEKMTVRELLDELAPSDSKEIEEPISCTDDIRDFVLTLLTSPLMSGSKEYIAYVIASEIDRTIGNTVAVRSENERLTNKNKVLHSKINGLKARIREQDAKIISLTHGLPKQKQPVSDPPVPREKSEAPDNTADRLREENRELLARLHALEKENIRLKSKEADTGYNMISVPTVREGASLIAAGPAPEMYEGEKSEIIIAALSEALKRTPTMTRRHAMIAELLAGNPSANKGEAIFRSLKNAASNGIDALIRELKKLGMEITPCGSGHTKATYGGLSVTLSSTPSDYRTGLNSCSDLRRTFF